MRIFMFLVLMPLVMGDYYKETQNFKFSRTSPDEGEKKGFYEAQSGNMGGNFEISRNMDTLAQRQLKDLRHQVGNQLGIDPHSIGTGAAESGGPTSVFGSASTSGTVKGSLSDYDTQQKEQDFYNSGNSYNFNQRGNSRGRTLEQSRTSTTHNAGMSAYSTNTDYDDSQRMLDIGAVNNGYTHGNAQQTSDSMYRSSGSTGSRQVVGTRYQSAVSGADSEGTSNVRYEAGPYIPKTSRTDSVATGSRHYGGSSNAYQRFGSQTHDVDTQSSGSGVTRVYVPVANIVPVAHTQGQTTGSQSSFMKSSMSAKEYESSGLRTSGSTVVEPSNRPVQPVYVRTGELNNGQQYVSENSQSQFENSGTSTVHVRPGTRVHIKTIPGQAVRVVVPVESTQRIENSESHTAGQNFDTTAQVYEIHPERNVNVGHSRESQFNERQSVTGENARTSGHTIYQRPVYKYNTRKYHTASTVAEEESNTANENVESTHTGRTYGGSSQTQQESRVAGTRARTSDLSVGGAHNFENVGDAGSNVNQYGTQPKSYQSSYSYHKAWERHGTPYHILPNGETVPITSDSQLNAGFDQSKGDMASSASEGQSRYVSGQQSSSRHSSGSQFGSSHGTSYSGNQQDRMSEMQERLQNQMNQMCQDCGGTKTKGYSAQYSYSAQRSYGGKEETSH